MTDSFKVLVKQSLDGPTTVEDEGGLTLTQCFRAKRLLIHKEQRRRPTLEAVCNGDARFCDLFR